MRTLFYAIVLFAVGFVTVAIGQKVVAHLSKGHAVQTTDLQDIVFTSPGFDGLPGESHIENTDTPTRTLAEYLGAANRAFAALDRNCSEAARAHLAQTYYDFLVARLQAIRDSAVSSVDSRTESLEHASDLEIYAQVIDATRRGVLKARHFARVSKKYSHVLHAAQRQEAATGPVPHLSHKVDKGFEPVSAVRARQVKVTNCPPAPE